LTSFREVAPASRAKEPKFPDIDKFDKEPGKSTDAETKACNEMLTGMVELEGDCEEGYECKGEHTKCKTEPQDEEEGLRGGQARQVAAS